MNSTINQKLTTIHTTAEQLADVCLSKNLAYGDSVGKSAQMLELLYPHGLRPGQYLDALIAARIFDKQSRLAQGNDPHGEDPRLDIGGYALYALHQSREVGPQAPCESVNEDAASKSTATPVSAAKSAAAPTLPSDAETLVWKASRKVRSSSASTSEPGSTSKDSAPAPTAHTQAPAASASVEGQRRFEAKPALAACAVVLIGTYWFLIGPQNKASMTIAALLMFLVFMAAAAFLLGWFLGGADECDADPCFFDREAE